jgi:ABC-2 type transport system ATP-binding protein
MASSTILQVTEFSFSYGVKPVLQNFSLALHQGSIHGLLGPNGAGKTTLFNCLFDAHRFPKIRVEESVGKAIAYLQSDAFYYPYMTGGEYLEIVAGGKLAPEIASWNVHFDLPLNEYVHRYSTGMKKKIGLLGVLLLKKDLLLLDEPTNGLDLETVEFVKAVLDKLRSAGKAVLLSSHIYESLLQVCDRITLLEPQGPGFTFEREAFGELTALLESRRTALWEGALEGLIQ